MWEWTEGVPNSSWYGATKNSISPNQYEKIFSIAFVEVGEVKIKPLYGFFNYKTYEVVFIAI